MNSSIASNMFDEAAAADVVPADVADHRNHHRDHRARGEDLHDHEPGDLEAQDRGQVDLQLERRRVEPGELDFVAIEHVAQRICTMPRPFRLAMSFV